MAKNILEQIESQLKKSKIKRPKKTKKGGTKKAGQKSHGIITKSKRSVLSKIQARSNARIKAFKIKQKRAKERREQEKKVRGYFRKKRTETKEQKERRLAKGYLTRQINKLEKKENLSVYEQNLLQELKMNRENIDKTYKDVRKIQKTVMENKESLIVETIWNTEYYSDEELAMDVEDILVDKSYDEIRDMLYNDDKLLFEIRTFPPTTFWHETEEEQRNDLENFKRTVQAFISKYKTNRSL